MNKRNVFLAAHKIFKTNHSSELGLELLNSAKILTIQSDDLAPLAVSFLCRILQHCFVPWSKCNAGIRGRMVNS